MNLNLNGKIFIVTGGAKGIGWEIVKILASENAIPVIVGRKEDDNLKALESIGNKGFQLVAELTKPGDCESVIKQIVKKYNCIDGLINNACVNDGVGLGKGNYEQFVASLHNNLVHYYLMAHHALPYLKQRKGVIVNIDYKTAETGHGNTSAYTASNSGGNALTREWAVELLKYGIRVNEVVVDGYLSPLDENRIKTFDDREKKLKSIREKTPFETRVTTAEEIANMVVFLLSDRSGHTTGQIIHVDGGYMHIERAI